VIGPEEAQVVVEAPVGMMGKEGNLGLLGDHWTSRKAAD